MNSNWSYSPETVKLGCDLCDLDLWPWPFAWTSLLSLVITPENFMMIGWWEHGQKGVTDRRTDRQTDGQTDGRTDWTIHRAAWIAAKNNRAPLLCCFQLCAWFHCHMWIQTGVKVRKRLSWVLTSVTLTFDLWPWPFAWTSLLTMVITHGKFHDDTMMGTWWKRCERRTDGRTDRRIIPFAELLGRS